MRGHAYYMATYSLKKWWPYEGETTITKKGRILFYKKTQDVPGNTLLFIVQYIFLYLFQKNDTLKSLRMTGNKIGNKGGMWFAQALQVNTGLEALDVADTDLVSIWFSVTGGKC